MLCLRELFKRKKVICTSKHRFIWFFVVVLEREG